MFRRSLLPMAALLAVLGVASGVAAAQQSKPAPSKAPLQVTYYYLPG